VAVSAVAATAVIQGGCFGVTYTELKRRRRRRRGGTQEWLREKGSVKEKNSEGAEARTQSVLHTLTHRTNISSLLFSLMMMV